MANFEYNRRDTQDDYLKQTNEVRDERRAVPVSDILDEPLYCLHFNEDWKSHIIGAVSTLQKWSAWIGDDDDTNTGTRQITKFLAQDFSACGGDCTIEELLSDETFFETEYIPQTFGDWYTVTNDHNGDLNALYDGTPQSIGEDIPTGTPDDLSKNALCYAMVSFVGLYASSKLCIIQSKNFLQIAWNELQDAANKVYNTLANSMAFIYTPNLFSCFVDDDEAITVLQDEAAQEELGCYLYDELKVVTISQSNFDDALLAAATSLTGNAGKLACIMQNDSNLTIYINFLEAYQIALNRINNGETLDCPCETGNYRVVTYDFANGFMEWRPDYVINTSTRFGTPQSDGIAGIQSSANVQGVSMFLDGHDPTWRVHGYSVEYSRDGAGGTGVDLHRMFFRPNPASTSGQANLNPSTSALAGSHIFSYTNLAVNTYQTNFRQIWVNFQCNSPGSENIIVHKISIWYIDGFAPGGYFTNDEPAP